MEATWEVLHTNVAMYREVEEDCQSVQYLNDYKILEMLGQGSFGRVHRCIRCVSQGSDSDNIYAIKFLSRSRLRKARTCIAGGSSGYTTALQQIYNEVNLMNGLYHRNILLLFEFIDDIDEDQLALVLEWASGGPVMLPAESSSDYLASFLFSDAAKLMSVHQLASDLIQGVRYLHTKSIAHLDIKPSNLLLAKNTTTNTAAPFVLRIADFACAQHLATSTASVTNSPGTIAFWPPECISSGEERSITSYSAFAADCYAVGLTLHCFLFLHLPYTCSNKDVVDVMDAIKGFDVSFCDELQLLLSNSDSSQEEISSVAVVEHMLLQKDVSMRYDIFAAAAEIDTELPP